MAPQKAVEADRDVIDGNAQPDYTAVNIPTKNPEDYTYAERRAEILQLVEQAGHPKAVNQTELAQRYGVSQPTISKDLDRLDEYIRDRISARRDLKIKTTLDRALRGLLEEGEYYQAAKVAKMYDDYVEERLRGIEFANRLEELESKAEALHE